MAFYGIPPLQLADPVNLKIPMQYHFGDKDLSKGFADIHACDKLRDTLKSTGKYSVSEIRHAPGASFKDIERSGSSNVQEFHRYVEGNHAFMNEEAPAYPFNKHCADLAFAHTISFFKQYL